MTVAGLTERQAEILGHIAGGRTAAQIAMQLRCSESHVKDQLRLAYHSLGAVNAPQAVAKFLSLQAPCCTHCQDLRALADGWGWP